MGAKPDGRAIRNAADAAALFAPRLAGLVHEELHVAHLDPAFRPVGFTVVEGGRAVAMPVRRIVADALRLDARAMLLAHNHPGGDPAPSRADRRATQLLAELACRLDIRVLDHLVFGAADYRSFRAMALL